MKIDLTVCYKLLTSMVRVCYKLARIDEVYMLNLGQISICERSKKKAQHRK